MDKKIIFVNATSATRGGSLTILKQFIEELETLQDNSKKYYIFVPICCEIKSTLYFEIIPIEAKTYKDRIIWDLYGMKRWSKDKELYPNLILSLQNTGVKFDKVKQIIYLHQPLPYSKDSKWNLLKKDERKMWFYKHVYKIWIDLTIHSHDVIVQTNWMKDALIKEGYSEKKITISKPIIAKINVNDVTPLEKEDNKVYLFYPAADYKYKNHITIIKAINLIKKQDLNNLSNIKVLFTVGKDSALYQIVSKYGLLDNIIFLGNLNYEDVLKYYKTSDVILFPSYIETFGLPLIESAVFGKKIIASDCNYAREVLESYELVDYIKYNNVELWANKILSSIKATTNNKKNYKSNKIKMENGCSWNSVFQLINRLTNL